MNFQMEVFDANIISPRTLCSLIVRVVIIILNLNFGLSRKHL